MRAVLTIALHEARRYLPFVRPRMGLAVVVLAVLLGVGWSVVQERGLDPEEGLYIVEHDGAPPILPVLEEDARFRLVQGDGGAFRADRADLFVGAGGVVHVDATRQKSLAAWHELDRATRAWIDGRLGAEADQAAAFPVRVALDYEPRVLPANGGAAPSEEADASAGGTGTTVGGNGTAPTDPDAADAEAADAGRTGDAATGLRPDDIEPPFPIRSLLLTFAYLIPTNFVAQLFAGAMLHVRLRRRGLILLSTPHGRGTVLAGLSLPYALIALVVAAGVTVAIGAGWLGFVAVLPVLVVMLTAALLTGLLARSQREMTFLLVAVSTGLASYLFLPAMFVQVHPVAFLSPMAVVSASIRAEPVALGAFLYATAPMALAATALIALAVALFKAEHLFAPSGLVTRFVDGLGDALARRRHLATAGVLAVPFALALELFVVVVAVMLELRVALLAFLFGAALVEEALKGVAVVAHRRRRADAHHPLTAGLLVGGGFFLGEKIALFAALAGFGVLPFGETALATFGVANAAVLVIAPLVLHVGTASISAALARRAPFVGVWLAMLVHIGYNAAVILGGSTG